MVYLALAHGTDADLDDAELAVMTKKLKDWAPELDLTSIHETIMEALALYLHGDRDDQVKQAILNIRNEGTFLERLVALDDLVQIAEADGVVLESEEGLIKMLTKIWKVRIDE